MAKDRAKDGATRGGSNRHQDDSTPFWTVAGASFDDQSARRAKRARAGKTAPPHAFRREAKRVSAVRCTGSRGHHNDPDDEGAGNREAEALARDDDNRYEHRGGDRGSCKC